MVPYQHFIGIDIGKFTFVATLHGHKTTTSYDNNPAGFKTFLKDFKNELPTSLIVLEPTGGYESALLSVLCDKNHKVHRANTRKVKNFIRSLGHGAKTDALDAKALAFYGFERHARLDLFTPISKKLASLYELAQRRNDLKQMLVAEKNRAKAPKVALVKDSYARMLEVLKEQIAQISQQIKTLIDSDPALLARAEILKTIPGIGDITSQDLLAFLPELGSLTREQIASLAGLAPRANDSGKFRGYRHTAPGRQFIRPALFLSAMAARNSHSPLRAFYESLINRGKKKMVALVALMRKIIVIANARLKEKFFQQHS